MGQKPGSNGGNLDFDADAAITAFRRRQSVRFIECAINLAAMDYDHPSDVAEILRSMADDLENYG